ncbi:MAG: hypothetical protein ABI277_16215 [Burkholderiaceae bacterium]
MLRRLCVIALLVTLAACASPSLSYQGAISISEDPRAQQVASRRIPLKDRVVIVTDVAWPETDRVGGRHSVRWNWYEGDTLIAERAKMLDFPESPYRFVRSLAASDLGIGHYRVEVLVDGRRVDVQRFDVVAD